MKFTRLTAALASGLLLWGSAYAEQPQNAAPEAQSADAATGATAPGVVILELQGGAPGAQEGSGSPEEMLAMQLLLLQLLMMQQGEPAVGADLPVTAPTAGQVGI